MIPNQERQSLKQKIESRNSSPHIYHKVGYFLKELFGQNQTTLQRVIRSRKTKKLSFEDLAKILQEQGLADNLQQAHELVPELLRFQESPSGFFPIYYFARESGKKEAYSLRCSDYEDI